MELQKGGNVCSITLLAPGQWRYIVVLDCKSKPALIPTEECFLHCFPAFHHLVLCGQVRDALKLLVCPFGSISYPGLDLSIDVENDKIAFHRLKR